MSENGPAVVVGGATWLGMADILASISASLAERVCLTGMVGLLSVVMLSFLKLQAASLWY